MARVDNGRRHGRSRCRDVAGGGGFGLAYEVIASVVVDVASPSQGALFLVVVGGVEAAQVIAQVGVAVEKHASVGGVDDGCRAQVVASRADAFVGEGCASEAVHAHPRRVIETPLSQLPV
jgi:hypothetical protein